MLRGFIVFKYVIRNAKLCAIKTQKNSKIAGKVLVAILEKLDGGVTISKEIRYQF